MGGNVSGGRHPAAVPAVDVPPAARVAELPAEKDKAAASALLKRIDPAVDADQVRFDAPVRTSSAAPLSRLFTEGRGVGTMFLWLGFGMCMLMVYGLNTGYRRSWSPVASR